MTTANPSSTGNGKPKEVPDLEHDPHDNNDKKEQATPSALGSSNPDLKAHKTLATKVSVIKAQPSSRNSDKRPATKERGNPSKKARPGIQIASSGAPKRHRFVKKNFAHPTWCQFNNKFISGLNKSGYECRDCRLPVSRRCIAEAKKTICGEAHTGMMEGSTDQQAQAFTKNKVFTVYLPHGAKKSVLLNPMEPLRNVLEKICAARGMNMSEFVPEDTNGNLVSLDTVLGKISGYEITFTRKDGVDTPVPPIVGTLSGSSKPSPPTSGATTPSSPLDEPEDKAVDKKKPSGGGKKGKRRSQKLDSKRILTSGQSVSSASLTTSTTLTSTSSSPPTAVATPAHGPLRITEAYDIGRELGSGAFSVVKEGIHKETGKVVAIKILDKYEDDDEQTQKFKQEISIISSLHHENIVQFYELDSDDENFYVAMELVGGGELFDYIIENGTIEETEAACIIAQVLKAVEYMHAVGTAHRDLKPENLLFKSEDRKIIKIADFGESKSFKEGMLSTYCGTPDYMAPEIIKGEPYASAVDLWALGVITYVMLAGFPPFDGDNDVEVFASILAVRYDFPSPEWDNISEEAKDFVSNILLEDAPRRMSASQCLAHPWIVNNVPSEMRVNLARSGNSAPNVPSIGSRSPSSADIVKADSDDGAGDKSKKQVVEVTQEALKLATELQSVHVGELKVMAAVLEATTGKGKSDLEKSIYSLYWARAKELQSALKNTKKSTVT